MNSFLFKSLFFTFSLLCSFLTFAQDTTTYNICQGDAITLTDPDFVIHNWALSGDPNNVISTNPTLTVTPLNTTSYILFDNTDTSLFNIIISPPLSVNLGPDRCDLADQNSFTLTATQPNVNYLWSDGSNGSTLTASNSGVYWVQVSNAACVARDTVILQFEDIEIRGDTIVACMDTITLNVNDSNIDVGTWEYLAPPGAVGNVTFVPNNNVINPFITVPELGEYIFLYTSLCGNVDTHYVDFQYLAPELDITLTQQCNFDIDLEASTNQDGHWTATGPEGETINIDDANSANTNAVVSNYGLYTFTYTYDFCNASFSHTIDIQSVAPIITNTQDYFVCDKSINLVATVLGHEGSWSVEGDNIVTFVDFQSLTTEATVAEYGDYTFYYTGCGGTDTFDVTFVQTPPTINAPTYVECATEALVEVIYVDDNIGTWSFEPGTIENITLTELDDHTVSVSSDSYGEVDITYTTCDSFATVNIVFMCELDIPNVFTPNNDGINNEFSIRRLSTKYYNESVLTVYDRWGVEVYTNGKYGLEGAWWNGRTAKNGEELKDGVYYYELNLHNKVNDLHEIYTGTVNIFR